MQPPEEKWPRLVDKVGLANATRLIMAENPGEGDSVKELGNIWEGKSVLQIYEAILLEKPSFAPGTVGLWSEVRAGANAFHLALSSPSEVQPSVTCNSWL
jgi:hypothetical protein